MMTEEMQLVEVKSKNDIFPQYRGTAIEKLLSYHNLEMPFEEAKSAELLIGMCMDNRKQLNIPGNFAFIIRTAGANLRHSEFQVSFAISLGNVKAIALIGHTQCGMVNVMSKQKEFVEGLIRNAGWQTQQAEQHFTFLAPYHEIGDEISFVLGESKRLRLRYPSILVAPMLYRVEDGKLYQIQEDPQPAF